MVGAHFLMRDWLKYVITLFDSFFKTGFAILNNAKRNLAMKISNTSNPKFYDLFERSAICIEIIDEIYKFERLTESTKEVVGAKKRLVEDLRRNSFFVVVLYWCVLFGNDKESMHWKKVDDGSLKDFLLERAEIDAESYRQVWESSKTWRDRVIAHSDLEKNLSLGDTQDLVKSQKKLVQGLYVFCEQAMKKLNASDFPIQCLDEVMRNAKVKADLLGKALAKISL